GGHGRSADPLVVRFDDAVGQHMLPSQGFGGPAVRHTLRPVLTCVSGQALVARPIPDVATAATCRHSERASCAPMYSQRNRSSVLPLGPGSSWCDVRNAAIRTRNIWVPRIATRPA